MNWISTGIGILVLVLVFVLVSENHTDRHERRHNVIIVAARHAAACRAVFVGRKGLYQHTNPEIVGMVDYI